MANKMNPKNHQTSAKKVPGAPVRPNGWGEAWRVDISKTSLTSLDTLKVPYD